MEKNNGKVIAIVALVVAVVALSVGFAAFSDTLTIDGNANVSAAANPFDDSTNGLAYSTQNPTCYKTGATSTTLGTPGTASGDTWSGISVPLSSANPSITCTATVLNSTSYDAYLTKISTPNNNGDGLTCSSSGANATTNAANVCNGAQVTVTIGSNTATINKDGLTEPGSYTASVSKSGGTATVTVTISYNSSALTDEDVTVTIPTITHAYSSANPNS